MSVREQEEEGNGTSCSPEGEHTGSFVLRFLSLSCRLEFYGKSQGRISREYSSAFLGVHFQGYGLQ